MYELRPSSRSEKKWMITIPSGKTVHFGAKGYEDYTTHRDPIRKDRYIARHRSRENWTKHGIDTAGFWARWLLWNKPSLQASINDTMKRFNIDIVRKRK
jgi:hypothetical protein